jgi:hypothetical protein
MVKEPFIYSPSLPNCQNSLQPEYAKDDNHTLQGPIDAVYDYQLPNL